MNFSFLEDFTIFLTKSSHNCFISLQNIATTFDINKLLPSFHGPRDDLCCNPELKTINFENSQNTIYAHDRIISKYIAFT